MFQRPIRTFSIVLLLALLMSCDPEIRCNVLHIGDSLMSSSALQIEAIELCQEKAVLPIMNAIPGSGLMNNDYWIPRIGFIKDRAKFEAVFISLGTNDATMDPEDFPTFQELYHQIDEVLSAIGPDSVVYWILPHKNIRSMCAAPQQFDMVKYAILSAYKKRNWPNLNLLSFDIWIKAQKKQMDLMLEADGVHFTETGKEEFARMIQYYIDKSFPV